MGYRDRNIATIEDANRKNSHPLLATVIGSIILLASAGSAPSDDPTNSVAYALGSGFGAVLVVGGIAWFATLRHASDGWKAASLITLFVVGALSGLVKIGNARAQFASDAKGVANEMQQMMNAPEGSMPQLSEGSSPLSRMSAVMVNGIANDFAAFDKESESAGLVQIISFEGLTKSSPVLDHCDRVSGLSARARYFEGRLPGHIEAAQKIGRDAVSNGTASQSLIDDFIGGARDNRNPYTQWQLLASISEEAGALCDQLAQRRWVKDGDMIRFMSDVDLRNANARLERIKQIEIKMEQIRAKAKADAEVAIEKMRAL